MSQSSAVAGEATYFDLHTQGLGYLNRIREVTPSRGKAFLACTIAARSEEHTSELHHVVESRMPSSA